MTSLVEKTNDLARNVLATGLLVVHDSSRGGQDDEAELTRRQEPDNPLLQVVELDVVSWGDDTSLVEAEMRVRKCSITSTQVENLPAIELNDDLAVAVVVHLLKLANVACACVSVLVASD